MSESYISSLGSRLADLESWRKRLESEKTKEFAPFDVAAALVYQAVKKELPFYHHAVCEFIEELTNGYFETNCTQLQAIRKTFERCPHVMKWDTDLDILARDVLNLIVREAQ